MGTPKEVSLLSDPPSLAYAAADSSSRPDLVAAAVDPSSLDIQREIADGWAQLIQQRQIEPEQQPKVQVLGSIEDAVKQVRGLAKDGQEVEVLVTGSLILIGGLMEVAGFPMEV